MPCSSLELKQENLRISRRLMYSFFQNTRAYKLFFFKLDIIHAYSVVLYLSPGLVMFSVVVVDVVVIAVVCCRYIWCRYCWCCFLSLQILLLVLLLLMSFSLLLVGLLLFTVVVADVSIAVVSIADVVIPVVVFIVVVADVHAVFVRSCCCCCWHTCTGERTLFSVQTHQMIQCTTRPNTYCTA